MKKVFIAGHNGLVGSALLRALRHVPEVRVITAKKDELNLLNQSEVFDYFCKNKMDQIFLCAAKVGGIEANTKYPAEFIYENIIITANVIHAAFNSNVHRLLFLGSSCIYPKECVQPITEDLLLTGSLEKTKEPYSIEKISGLKL